MRLLISLAAVVLIAFPSTTPCEQPQIRSAEEHVPGISQEKDASPSTQNTDTLPARVLIPGVPFISWRESAQYKGEDSEIANPSLPAAFSMLLEYWGKDRKLLDRADFDPESSGFKVIAGNKDNKTWTTTDVKSSLARGIPVLVSLPLTPMAHPLFSTFEIMVNLTQEIGVELNDEGRPRSNALGRMLSLEEMQKIKEHLNMSPIQESVVIASRLVIGYDDDKKTFMVHDPSFGPVFELRYTDFDRMWAAVDRSYVTFFPDDLSQGKTYGRSVTAYPARTPDEKAATHFVYGYALDCLGRLDEGKEHFEKGLSIPMISKGYRFLLLFELALNLGERNDIPGAIEAAEKAKAILPEHPLPWGFLSQLYTISPDKGNRKKAKEAGEKAKTLEADEEGVKIVADTLPSDFFIEYLAGVRGWGGGVKP